jgi:hypothetical protein
MVADRLRRRTSRTGIRAVVENDFAGVFTSDNHATPDLSTVSVDERRGLAHTSHIRVKARNAITPRGSPVRCPNPSARSRYDVAALATNGDWRPARAYAAEILS